MNRQYRSCRSRSEIKPGPTLAYRYASMMAGSAIVATQHSTAAMAADDVAELGEVTITARHYRPDEQTTATGLSMQLIDTPQPISIITPEMLQVAGATSIYEATDLVPGLRRSGTGFGLDRFILRGNLLQEHRINGTNFNIWHSLEDYAFQRVEVVRGPATALYGVTGSFGGEINQILKAPQKDFSAQVGYRGGEWSLKEWQADVTGAIPGTDDRLSARFVGLYRDYGEWVDPSIYKFHDWKSMAMGALQYDFTDNTVAHLWFYYDGMHADPMDGGGLQSLPDGTLTFPKVAASNWYFSDPAYTRNVITNEFVVADVEHRFPNDWRLKAQATFSKTRNDMSEYFVFGPAGAYDLPDNEIYLYSYDQYQDSEAATFDLSLNGKFQALGREQQFFAAFEGQGTATPTKGILYNSNYLGNILIDQGGRGVFADGSPIPTLNKADRTIRNIDEGSFRDYRVSLQMLIDPIDRVKVLAGVLVQHTTINNIRRIDGGSVVVDPEYDRTVYTQAVKRGGVTYDLLGRHGVMDATKTYFNYSEGFNPNIGIVDQNGRSLKSPQLMKQYEVGVKSEFLNGRVGSSLAVYNSRITNLPVQTSFLGEFGSSGSVLEGTRRVKGLEYEVVGEIVRGWNVAFNYAYTFTEISDPNYDFRIPVKSVPRNAGALYSSYEFTSGLLAGFRPGFAVVSSGNYTLDPSLGNTAKFGQYAAFGGTRLDLNFSYRVPETWLRGLEVYGNAVNITNRYTYLAKEDHPGFGITRDTPRQLTFGVRYTYN